MKPTFDKTRPLSWSAISSFEYDHEQWYRKYVLKQEDPATKEMLFGSEIGKKLASDPAFLPHVPRSTIFEYELRFEFNKIPMIGFIDGWDKDTFELREYKTGKKAWDQKRADTHNQFDMYLLGLHKMHKIKPEDVQLNLHWLPTQDTGDFGIEFIDEKQCRTFQTSRTMMDLAQFGMRINDVYKQMISYCENHEC